jgi:hypothetical protein
VVFKFLMPFIARKAATWCASLMLVGVITGAFFAFNPKLGVLLLVASWKTTPGGIGIPGLTKTYEAALTNRGVLPVHVSVCDYVTDAFEHGKSIAHSEEWGVAVLLGSPTPGFLQTISTRHYGGLKDSSRLAVARAEHFDGFCRDPSK